MTTARERFLERVTAEPDDLVLGELPEALVAHAPGRHNQKSHGNGATGHGTWKDGKVVSGSKAPARGTGGAGGDPREGFTDDASVPLADYMDTQIDGAPAGAPHPWQEGKVVYGKSDGRPPWDAKDNKTVDRYVVDKNSETTALNRKMRSGETLTSAEKTRVRNLTKLSERASFTRDSRVYRTANFSDEKVAEFRPGARITDNAFMSTSNSTPYVGEQVSGSMRGNTLFSIEAPAGTPVIPMQYGEFVFPPGTTMEVVSVRHEEKGFTSGGPYGLTVAPNTTMIQARIVGT